MRFKFVHAADLHLDAVLPFPLQGGEPEESALPEERARIWREAPFLALRRLTDFCIANGAALLLLAGDIYDSRQGSLKARLELRDACLRLEKAGILVFWARGNHDPLDEDQSQINWPGNLVVFNAAGQSYALDRPAGQDLTARLLETGAALPERGILVHGISHAGPRESENLALRLRESIDGLGLPASGGGRFSLGVLHCNIGGQSGGKAGGHENYAPCSLSDLGAAPVDYWALGHIHQPGILAESPCAVYAGCPQGLHVRERGERGCWLGQVEDGRLAALDFHQLAPLRWEYLELNLTALEERAEAEERAVGLEDLEEFIFGEMQNFAAALAGGASPPAAGVPPELVFRVILSGRTSLDGVLRKAGSLEDLTARLNRRQAESDWAAREAALPRMLIKDIKLDTRPPADLDDILSGDNLVAETLRRALAVAGGAADESKLLECLALLNVLYADSKAEAWLAELRPGLEELSELAREAAALCLDLFEVE